MSSKKGWSSPIPRAIGAAGEAIGGASGGGERRRAIVRRSMVALSVAIAADIEARAGLCERRLAEHAHARLAAPKRLKGVSERNVWGIE